MPSRRLGSAWARVAARGGVAPRDVADAPALDEAAAALQRAWQRGAQVRAALLEDELHARDGTGGEYANNVPGQFRLQITNDTVRRHVLRA